jgi:hypothetical protein
MLGKRGWRRNSVRSNPVLQRSAGHVEPELGRKTVMPGGLLGLQGEGIRNSGGRVMENDNLKLSNKGRA